ncbi:MAG: hypothetical protein LBR07_00800 [Puniceicoccales bacterium]|jgi:hypothetical protein|nr:hypothetical protein [Puniceicoccales bacterium]
MNTNQLNATALVAQNGRRAAAAAATASDATAATAATAVFTGGASALRVKRRFLAAAGVATLTFAAFATSGGSGYLAGNALLGAETGGTAAPAATSPVSPAGTSSPTDGGTSSANTTGGGTSGPASGASASSSSGTAGSGATGVTGGGSSGTSAAATGSDDETVVLAAEKIEGADVENSVLPVRPNSSFYGFDELVQNTPRSIFQVAPTQLATDSFQSFNDLSRYSPSVGRLGASNFSTFSYIRGGTADTSRNGVLLLPAAVRPFNNNAWESVDIIAGVPSVIQGSTVRTAGVVNYVTKKPFFDKNSTEFTLQLGRLGTNSNTTYPQVSAILDQNYVVKKDELAVRVSLQRTYADQYWGNSLSDFYDLYGAITWKPTKNLTINTNYNYTDAGGPMPYGINRVDQNLIDNWQYRSGLYVPNIRSVAVTTDADGRQRLGSTLSYYEDPVTGVRYAGGLYASRTEVGKFSTSKDGPYNISAADLHFSRENPVAVTFSAPSTYTLVPVNGTQTLYSDRAFSDTKEHVLQNIAELKVNEHLTIRNNSMYHQVNSYVYGSDGYHSYMINKMATTRFEFATDYDFSGANSPLKKLGAFGDFLKKIGVRHQSNTGFEVRYLWNLCDMVSSSNLGWSDTQDVTNPADGGGRLGYGTILSTDNIYADIPTAANGYPWYFTAQGTPRYAASTDYGFYALINANFPTNDSNGTQRYTTIVPFDGMIRINQLTQTNVFTEQKLTVWKFFLRGGARVTFISDRIKPTWSTDYAIDNGLLPGYTKANFRAKTFERNYDINGSISFQPVEWMTVYAALDRDYASSDCSCCMTVGFSTDYRDATHHNYEFRNSDFHRLSTLREFGAKFEIIKNQLFATFAYFDQARYTPQAPSDANPDGYNANPTTYKGYEFSLAYQPSNAFSVGANLSQLEVKSIGVKQENFPDFTTNFWLNYQFPSGFGLKASLWATSSWKANATAKVHSQFSLDIGAYYAAKNWRVSLDIMNVTDEKNWAQGSNYSGNQPRYLLPAERLGAVLKATYKL